MKDWSICCVLMADHTTRSRRALAETKDIVIDVRHFVSWFSLLKVTQVFGEMKPDDILEVRGADTDMKKDLFKILPESTYQLLKVDYEKEEGFHLLRIQKRV